MTKDVIALTRDMPDPLSVLAGLLAGGPDKLAGTTGDDAVVQLCDEAGRPLVSVEAPVFVRVAGEAERLLGAEPPPVPFWWTEARATTGVEEAEALAGAFAARVASLTGGTVWPARAANTLAVVGSGGVSAVPLPAAAQPAVDVLTDKVAVVIQDRPVVAMTAWLSDAFRAAAAAGLGLQIVTPAACGLSSAVRSSLSGWPSRWVVQDERDGYYDGLSGAVLRWQDGMFAAVEAEDGEQPEGAGHRGDGEVGGERGGTAPDLGDAGDAASDAVDADPVAHAAFGGGPRGRVAASYREVERIADRQLALSFRAVHVADDRLILGGALESLWRELTGAPPAGWGTAEPANTPWSPRQLTDLARDRAPAPTWLVVVGGADRPALATVRVSRTTGGVEEDVTLTLGYGPDEELPLDALPRAAEVLATRHGLQSMLVQQRVAARDLTVRPRFEGSGVPLGFVLGAEEVRRMPGDRARRTPLSEPPVQLGPAARPALYYPLPGEPSDLSAWRDFERLMRHLKGA
jgi:hypothetical protein